MRLQTPASASSAALSSTSCTTCSGLSVRVYMPGRCLTGSRPLSTRMEASASVACLVGIGGDSRIPPWAHARVERLYSCTRRAASGRMNLCK